MFKDRVDAGEQLAKKLEEYRGNAVVTGIPRGGLEVAWAVANKLHCPFDCVFSKKIPHPFDSEVAIGAVSLGGVVVNEEIVTGSLVDQSYVEHKKRELLREIKQLDSLYHESVPRVDFKGKVVLLVDDGIATGETVKAALLTLRKQGAAKVILCVPVGPRLVLQELKKDFDDVVSVIQESEFQAVGQFYRNFPALSHDEAIAILENNPNVSQDC